MKTIYEGATRVLVWLGLGDPDTLAAFQRLAREEEHKIQLTLALETRRSLRFKSELKTIPKASSEDLSDSDSGEDAGDELTMLGWPTLGIIEPTKNEISAIDKIFKHPWWERVWIIQEATVTKELCVLCGRYELPWNMLCQICPLQIGLSGNHTLSPHEINLEPLQRLNDIRRQWKVFKDDSILSSRARVYNSSGGREFHFNLSALVSTFRTSKATDPRDKIYALVGLAGDENGVVLDYSVSTIQLYVGWAINRLDGQIDAFGNPDSHGVLRFLDYCLPSMQSLGLPSWVPDWAVSPGSLPVSEEFPKGFLLESFLLPQGPLNGKVQSNLRMNFFTS